MINVCMSEEILEKQKKYLLDCFKPLLENKNIIFLDAPLHSNVGDSLIFLGTLQLLKELNAKVIDVITAYEPRRISKLSIDNDTVLICQGGGNFGDIYTRHQGFRNKVIENFPNNKIVVFPQSIHYSDDNKLNQDCNIYTRVKNLHIFVRDLYSYDTLLSKNVNNVMLCPDIATVLINCSDFKRGKVVDGRKLNFLRKDIEANSTSKGSALDWCDIISKNQKMMNEVIVFLIKKNNRINLKKINLLLTKFMHKKLVNTAFNTFSKYDVVRTDRLHGMIFSQLLQMKCEALDNSYGKLERYIRQWFSSTDSVGK